MCGDVRSFFVSLVSVMVALGCAPEHDASGMLLDGTGVTADPAAGVVPEPNVAFGRIVFRRVVVRIPPDVAAKIDDHEAQSKEPLQWNSPLFYFRLISASRGKQVGEPYNELSLSWHNDEDDAIERGFYRYRTRILETIKIGGLGFNYNSVPENIDALQILVYLMRDQASFHQTMFQPIQLKNISKNDCSPRWREDVGNGVSIQETVETAFGNIVVRVYCDLIYPPTGGQCVAM